VLKQLVANYKVSLVLSTATQPALKHRDSLRCGFENVTEIVSDVKRTFETLRRVNVNWPTDLTTPVEWPNLAATLQKHDEVLCVVHRRDDARELANLLAVGFENGRVLKHLSALMCPRRPCHLDDALPPPIFFPRSRVPEQSLRSSRTRACDRNCFSRLRRDTRCVKMFSVPKEKVWGRGRRAGALRKHPSADLAGGPVSSPSQHIVLRSHPDARRVRPG
jgi:hypothetical protein